MTLNHTIAGALLLAIVTLWAGANNALGMSEEYKKAIFDELNRLEAADPAMDLETAFKQGDFGFVGLMGYAPEEPGVDQEEYYKKYHSEFGVKIITGTSDFLEIPAQGELNRIGTKYAERYNRLLLGKIAGRSFQELLRQNMEGK
ncbi:MAG: hypothetical protein ACREIS_01835 [Nitrospiraceae bacterium]